MHLLKDEPLGSYHSTTGWDKVKTSPGSCKSQSLIFLIFSCVFSFLTLYNTDIGTEVNRRCLNVNCCIKLTDRKYAHNCTRCGLIWEQWRDEMRHLPNVSWQCRGHTARWDEAISDYEAYHLSAWLSERKTKTPGNIYSPVRIPVLLAFHHQRLFFQFLKTKLQKLWEWT